MRRREANDRHNGAVIAWCLRDRTGHVLEQADADVVVPTASIGKVLLLLAVADALERGELDADAPLGKPGAVADSGLWQHLSVTHITARDAAVLVGSTSDNLATNALLDAVGLDEVQQVAHDLGYPQLRLHDRVRDRRTSAHPPYLSSGSATQWSEFMHGLSSGTLRTASACDQALAWLALSVDHSLVLNSFALDPLVADRPGWSCANKTGADPGIRADIGHVRRGDLAFSYAALAYGEPDAHAVAALRGLGERLHARFAR